LIRLTVVCIELFQGVGDAPNKAPSQPTGKNVLSRLNHEMDSDDANGGGTFSARSSSPRSSATCGDDPMRKKADRQTRLPEVLLESPALDDDHQRLLGLVNALIDAIASKAPSSVRSALGELRAEAEAHFAREETMMHAARYPRMKQHCARHQRLLRELGTLGVALNASGRLRLPLVPMNYIRRWFVAHVAGEDRMVASYLDENEDKFLIGLA